MPLSTAGKNACLDAVGITHVGAFTDFPADSGAGSNEVSGGSYARQAISFDAAASGSKAKASSPSVSIPIPAGTTVFFLGGFNASSAGSMRSWAPVNGGSTKGVGTAKNSGDVITSHGHGLSDTNRVFLTKANNESLPTGYSEGVLYYVVSATTDTFQLSLTSGGAAVTISADGELAFQKVIPEVFGSAGSLDVSAYTIDQLG